MPRNPWGLESQELQVRAETNDDLQVGWLICRFGGICFAAAQAAQSAHMAGGWVCRRQIVGKSVFVQIFFPPFKCYFGRGGGGGDGPENTFDRMFVEVDWPKRTLATTPTNPRAFAYSGYR